MKPIYLRINFCQFRGFQLKNKEIAWGIIQNDLIH